MLAFRRNKATDKTTGTSGSTTTPTTTVASTATRRGIGRSGSGHAYPQLWNVLRLTVVLGAGALVGYKGATWNGPVKRASSSKTQKASQRDSASSSAHAPMPAQCSASDLALIAHQLPATDCIETVKKPWENKCSFSYATRCPDAVWLTELYQKYGQRGRSKSGDKKDNSMVQAVYVGCNKAMDAVHTLRMISGNRTIDRDVWRTTFFGAESEKIEAGRCGQEHGEQFAIKSKASSRRAVVHCIEAMPVTASHLNQTAYTLGWQSHLWVRNVAMSDTDGTILFPNADKIGVENQGIENCKDATQATAGCQSVPLLRLDTYLDKNPVIPSKHKSRIDFLSIDVEGFDYPVLLGATESLQSINYLEFEYNWKGQWKEHQLSTAIAMLKDAGFVCYWPGAFGHLWRITDCWLDHYDLKFWSNVACVNRASDTNPWLARRMEDMFQRTLQKGGKQIQYANAATANTNGGWQAKATSKA